MLWYKHTLLNGRQLLVLFKPSRIYVHLLLYIVLLHDFHLSELMLVNQRLGKHLIRDKRESAVFATMEHF